MVTYADLFAVQPFGNVLVTLTLTGAQIKTLLEQQWLNQPKPRVLQVSDGFSYTWDDRRPPGDFVAAEGITLHGRPIDPAAPYRVTVNGFLAEGGDGFAVLKQAGEPRVGPSDVAALEAFFKRNSPLGPAPSTAFARPTDVRNVISGCPGYPIVRAPRSLQFGGIAPASGLRERPKALGTATPHPKPEPPNDTGGKNPPVGTFRISDLLAT